MRRLRETAAAPSGSDHLHPITSHQRGPAVIIDEEDLQEICAVQGFSRHETDMVRSRLQWIITRIGDATTVPHKTKVPQKRAIPLTEQIKLLRRQIARIKKMRAYRVGLDRDTSSASRRELLASFGTILGSDVTSCIPPLVTELARRRESRRKLEAANNFSIEIAEDAERRDIAAEYCAKLREEFERREIEALERVMEWLKNNAGKGGSKGNIWRARLIDELADLFMDLGRNPTPTKNGQFVNFVAGVLDAIGLPTEGVEDAVYKRLPQSKMSRAAYLDKLRDRCDERPNDEPDAYDYDD